MPTSPYNLLPYHLTLPVDKDGNKSGKAFEINGLSLINDYQSDWFKQDGSVFTFLCPDGGAVTDTAHYARSELRNEMEWSYTTHSIDTPYNLSVVQLGEGQKVCVGQIHDQNEPWLKIEWTHKSTGGELRALVKVKDGATDTVYSLLKGLKLNDIVSVQIEYKPASYLGLVSQHLVLTINGVKTDIKLKRSGKGGKAYFKRGNYYQTADRKGLICIVKHK